MNMTLFITCSQDTGHHIGAPHYHWEDIVGGGPGTGISSLHSSSPGPIKLKLKSLIPDISNLLTPVPFSVQNLKPENAQIATQLIL